MRASLVALFVAFPVVAAAQAEWAVSSKPILDVAGVDASGRTVLQAPGGATRLSNGGLLVVDRGATSIRLFDAAGNLVKSTGQRGAGPGEYQMLISGSSCGRDSLLVNAREAYVLFDASGSVARRFTIPPDSGRLITPDSTRVVPLMNLVCSENRIAFLVSPNARKARPTPHERLLVIPGWAAIVDRSGRLVQLIDSIPAGEIFTVPPGAAVPRPLGFTPMLAAVGDAVVIGVSDSAHVVVHRANGQRSRLTFSRVARAPTAQEFEQAVDAVAEMAPPNLRSRFRPEIAKAPMPERLPAFFGLFGDTEGRLWVQQSPPGATTTNFLVMDLEGRQVAKLSVPMAFSVYEIGRDYMLGTYSDANDELHIAVLGLIRR